MPRGVDITIFADDHDPELQRGYLVIPVSKMAKTWLSWIHELLHLDEISISMGPSTFEGEMDHLFKTGKPWYEGARSRTGYWIEMGRFPALMEDLAGVPEIKVKVER